MNTRILEIDIAKGFLILFVILGHSPISQWAGVCINSFHMAAFFCLSGMTYSYRGDLKNFFIKKSKGILLPYIEFSIILLAFAYLKTIANFGSGFDLLSGLESIIIPISGRTSTSVYGLWFLPCLYLIELVLALSEWLYNLKNILGYIFILFVLIVCLLLYFITGVASVLSVLPIGLCFVFLGTKLKKHIMLFIKHKKILFLFGLLLYLGALFFNVTYFTSFLDLSSMSLGCWVLYLISCLGGTIVILSISYFVNSRLLQKIGENSLYFYGLHYCIIGIVSKFLFGVWCTIVTFLLCVPLVCLFKNIRKKVKYL